VNAVRAGIAVADRLTAPLRSPRAAGIAAALVALLASAAVAATWHVFGHTWDEPEHLAAGLSLIDQGRYPYDIQHPPIARVAMALGPWLAGAHSAGKLPPDGRPEGVAILYGEGHYQLYLTLARAAMLPFFWLLLAVTWFWARDSGASPGQALLAVACAASTPPLLGHAGLAALDVPAAATGLLALWLMARWFFTGQWGEALWFGLAAGFAVGTKLSAIPFLAVGFLVLLAIVQVCAAAPAPGGRAPNVARGIRQGVAAGGLAILVLIAAYGGQWLWLTDSSHHYNHTLDYLFGARGPAHEAAYGLAAHVPVPTALPLLIGGIEALTVHNASGHPSFLLGEVRSTGWWYFYIVALAVKTPLPLLILGLAGLAVSAWDGARARAPWQLLPGVLFVALLAFASAVSRINIGVRHVLILYPLLALGAANGSVRAWRALGASVEPGAPMLAAVLAAALAWLFVTPLLAFPDYLAYFNATAPHPERVLIDSDLDWGQDLRRLERRLAELRVPSVSLAYLGTADLAREPLPPMTRLPPGTRTSGWVAITALARQRGGTGYDWLDHYPPVERVGKSIWLYDIPADDAGQAP
jgi:hypothetical protein